MSPAAAEWLRRMKSNFQYLFVDMKNSRRGKQLRIIILATGSGSRGGSAQGVLLFLGRRINIQSQWPVLLSDHRAGTLIVAEVAGVAGACLCTKGRGRELLITTNSIR